VSGIVTHSTIEAVRAHMDRARAGGASVGFVPTMGFLHAGHRSLMTRARTENDVVVVSIFVNPLQFAANEDLDDYPRDLDRDTAMCAEAGVDVLFVPTVEEMYPERPATTVRVAGISEPLEGVSRPTHFAGVATVVAKLFAIIGPCSAYFGEKDYQQLAVIRRMAVDLSFPVRVVGCDIVREPDGLALSSRNVYLSAEERGEATVLRRALDIGIDMVEGGETDPAVVEAAMADVIGTARHAALEYVAAVPASSLVASGPLCGEIRLLVAARFGSARLIDNAGCRVGGGAPD
jgi:pantoate--beta-alanine ligase